MTTFFGIDPGGIIDAMGSAFQALMPGQSPGPVPMQPGQAPQMVFQPAMRVGGAGFAPSIVTAGGFRPGEWSGGGGFVPAAGPTGNFQPGFRPGDAFSGAFRPGQYTNSGRNPLRPEQYETAAERAAKNAAGAPGTAGGLDFAGPTTADENQGLTGARIDDYIRQTRPNSPLVGMGDWILQTANAKNVSVPQLLGIMLLESELGTTGALSQYYNYGGLTGSGWGGQTGTTSGMARAFATFNSKESGLAALMDNLASPLYRGKSLQQQIGLWYLGDENAALGATDEHGNATMQQYLNTIASVYNALGVTNDPSARPSSTGMGRGGGAWLQTAMSFTREGGGWVDYTNQGIRVTGNPRDGFDCSSFTGYVLGLPRNIWNAQAQYDYASRGGRTFTDANQARPGDLIFFQGTTSNDPSARPVTHVAIYLGDGMMIHTGTPGRGVEVIPLSSMMKYFYGFGRVQ